MGGLIQTNRLFHFQFFSAVRRRQRHRTSSAFRSIQTPSSSTRATPFQATHMQEIQDDRLKFLESAAEQKPADLNDQSQLGGDPAGSDQSHVPQQTRIRPLLKDQASPMKI